MDYNNIKQHKDVVLINDLNCATAIMYSHKLRNVAVYMDQDHIFWTAFERTDQLRKAVYDYESNTKTDYTGQDYADFNEECIMEFGELTKSFDDTTSTDDNNR